MALQRQLGTDLGSAGETGAALDGPNLTELEMATILFSLVVFALFTRTGMLSRTGNGLFNSITRGCLICLGEYEM